MATHEHPGQAQARIVKVVKALMALNDENQEQLGHAVGMGQTAISKSLTCQRKLSVDELDRIAAHYGIGIGSFFEGPEALTRSRCSSTDQQVIDLREHVYI